jgi:hypothetical protein
MNYKQALPTSNYHGIQESLTTLNKQMMLFSDCFEKDTFDKQQYMEQFFLLKSTFDNLTQKVLEIYLKEHALKCFKKGDIHISDEVMSWIEEFIKG